jgi:DNA-directed RNA polymerase specialized sigma24 family protein
MMTASHCDCIVCRLEASLIAELSDDRSKEEFRLFAVSSPILASFQTTFKLIQQLHDQDNHQQNPSSDEVILHLLSNNTNAIFRSIWQRILLLVFIPTVHRTTSQIVGTFPSLTRDDTAQHILTVLLEFLDSEELHSRRSQLAFTIARKIRRSAFRWAIRESRRSLRDDTDAVPPIPLETDACEENSHPNILLRQFFDNCQRRGLLSIEERELLTKFKLEGISGPELARRNGHSAVAIRHRVQRVLGRLRRVAQTSGNGTAEQLNLFHP